MSYNYSNYPITNQPLAVPCGAIVSIPTEDFEKIPLSPNLKRMETHPGRVDFLITADTQLYAKPGETVHVEFSGLNKQLPNRPGANCYHQEDAPHNSEIENFMKDPKSKILPSGSLFANFKWNGQDWLGVGAALVCGAFSLTSDTWPKRFIWGIGAFLAACLSPTLRGIGGKYLTTGQSKSSGAER